MLLFRNIFIFCLILFCASCNKISARNQIKEGNDLYRAGKYEDALEKFESAAKLDPDFPILQLHIGYTAMALASSEKPPLSKEYAKKASAAFFKYMEFEPNDERGPKYYLQVLLDSEQLDLANKFLQKRHEKKPNDLKIISALGMVNSKAGDFFKALKWYKKHAELQPKESQPLYLIGTLCWEHLYKNESLVGVNRIDLSDQGINALKKALDLRPDYIEALTYINLLYRERAKGQTDLLAKEKDLKQADLYYKKALALLKKGAGK